MSFKLQTIFFLFSIFILFQSVYNYTKCIRTGYPGCDNEYYHCCGKNTECVRVTNDPISYGKCVRKG
ncbi:unnamed protein product [Meloidogyne enterolobii]|uniref:Uncharacterized protein n=1 Tax=Meloidogyne enterolobii TaxID=390850 RepID=A0ACB0ZI81_MELEN